MLQRMASETEHIYTCWNEQFASTLPISEIRKLCNVQCVYKQKAPIKASVTRSNFSCNLQGLHLKH
jgi:chemotaxis regulatin CheY-phosphate phosphatase CheZ